MNETSTIQDRLDRQADEKLKQRITQTMEPIAPFLRGNWINLTGLGIEEKSDRGKTTKSVWGYNLKEALEKAFFNAGVEAARQKEVDDFMAKVESLASQVEELQNSIPNDQSSKTMNADILKPYLEDLVKQFPGERMQAQMLMTIGADGKVENWGHPQSIYFGEWNDKHSPHYTGGSLEECVANAKAYHKPVNPVLKARADALRAEADRIEKGES